MPYKDKNDPRRIASRRAWDDRNRTKKNASSRKRYYSNLEEKRAWFRERYRSIKAEGGERYEKIKEANRNFQRKKREKVILHYGGKCMCCGEKELCFLSIDHINGGGRKERFEFKGNFIDFIIKNNYPTHLQVLCHNCNLAKGFYKVCPHQK